MKARNLARDRRVRLAKGRGRSTRAYALLARHYGALHMLQIQSEWRGYRTADDWVDAVITRCAPQRHPSGWWRIGVARAARMVRNKAQNRPVAVEKAVVV
jgi:hypothetical protein